MSASRFTWRTLVALAGLSALAVGAQPQGAPAGTSPSDPASPTAPATTPITPAPTPPGQPAAPAATPPSAAPAAPAAPAADPASPPAPPAAAASDPTSPRKPAVENSALDATLLYQLLIAEMELRQGDAGTAYQVMLDAARRTRSEQLFRRTTEIALRARAGEQALAAVVAWRNAIPQSQDALRFQVQLLVALNRVAEAEEPLRALLAGLSDVTRPAAIDGLPALVSRRTDTAAQRAAAAALIERLVAPYLEAPVARTSARVAAARAWLAAGEPAKALALVERASVDEPGAEAPALVALDLLPGQPAAEAIVTRHLAANPANTGMRLLYTRTLAASQRIGDARAQVELLTRSDPDLPQPWLTLGALEIELRHPDAAIKALQTYVRLVESGAVVAAPARQSDDDDDEPPSRARTLTPALLMLAQAAELKSDFAGAEAWLARVDPAQGGMELQTRRASLLARQGKVGAARELIRNIPETRAEDARAKVMAEVQLLRDQKLWSDAEQVLAAAGQRFPNDIDMLYEQAMMAEKLARVDEMERLLRRVIELKPDHHHAYNALGYSLAERRVRLPEARDLIRKALELSPGEPFITDSLGWVEFRLGNRDEALRLLRGAYQSRPDPEIGAHLGEVLWSVGQSEEAKRVWREARARDASNDVLRETLARLGVDL
ncbi:tetratricopeptide repeat protein [Piscinibacter koreensis]|uniref:Tetratricopeptide repeat protein n=1 Tax=Piscinibacter koreensis TaxID=2742824 RepID=A0A7Y6NP20_9BURK|nr:tetratricopeptide repeat protein [Schlegelella koreensis]NUZ06669.1 tetratricopeptide repeat protein [Schlegelella koreensis]